MEGIIGRNGYVRIFLNEQDISDLKEKQRGKGDVIALYSKRIYSALVEIKEEDYVHVEGTIKRVGRSRRERTVGIILTPNALTRIDNGHVVETFYGSLPSKKAFVSKKVSSNNL